MTDGHVVQDGRLPSTPPIPLDFLEFDNYKCLYTSDVKKFLLL